MIKKIVRIASVIILISMVTNHKASAQMYGVSTNILGLATGSINVGVDFKIGKKWSLEIPLYINPISTDNLSLVSYATQPALKYWFYNVFVGPYVAISNTSAFFDVGIDSDLLKKGWLTGVGLSYGYNMLLSKRISMNFEAGLGGFYTDFKEYKRNSTYLEDEYVTTYKKLLFLPTRLTCGIIYYF